MGNSKSKKTHSCTENCFAADINKTKNIFSDTLNQYNVELPEYIVDIIMEYLPSIEITQMESLSDKDYDVFIYPKIIEILNKSTPLCPVWIKQFKSKQYRGKKIDGVSFEEYIPQIKVVLYGEANKTDLVRKFVTGQYWDCSYDSCIEDWYSKMIDIKNQQLMFVILDNMLEFYEFEALHTQFMRQTQVFILCFNSQVSLNGLTKYWDKILEIKDKSNENNWGIILCATESHHRKKNSKMDTTIFVKKANEWNVPFVEVSARMDKNVELLFKYIVPYTLWIQSETECVNKILQAND